MVGSYWQEVCIPPTPPGETYVLYFLVKEMLGYNDQLCAPIDYVKNSSGPWLLLCVLTLLEMSAYNVRDRY